MLVDPYGRTINYLRISLTDMCNFRCTYCMPPEGVPLKPHREILRYEEIEAIVREAALLGITKIRLTGGEPLIKREITKLVAKLAAVPAVQEINITTNGSLLTPGLAMGLKQAGLSRLNISLDTLDPDKFRTLTRGGNLEDVLNGIIAAQEAGFAPIKINMIIFEDTSEAEIELMQNFCQQQGLVLQKIKHFSLYDRKDPAGAITADRPPKCAACNRLRLTADGFLKPCLFSSHEIKMDLGNIRKSLLEAVNAKPENGQSCLNRTMCQIGG